MAPRGYAGTRLSSAVRVLNARHPWSHNDHFHGWVLTELPDRRDRGLDVGCGRGGLLAALAPQFAEVHGVDVDPAMRRAAAERCAGLGNVEVSDASLAELMGPFDLVTMVAVLHHLDVPPTLQHVRRVLAPGGRFLAVGLAPPATVVDHAWDLASAITNPVIGYVKHPWPDRRGPQPPDVPIADPTMPFGRLRELVHQTMPGARMRHRLGFRHTISWTAPP